MSPRSTDPERLAASPLGAALPVRSEDAASSNAGMGTVATQWFLRALGERVGTTVLGQALNRSVGLLPRKGA